MQPRILVADDQADILSALKLLLKREGFDVATATSPAGVLDVTAREHVDVALVDLNYSRDTTSGEEGVALVDQIHRLHPGAAHRRDDGLGDRRGRREGDAPRRQ